MTEYPSPREASYYRVTHAYVRFHGRQRDLPAIALERHGAHSDVMAPDAELSAASVRLLPTTIWFALLRF